MKYSPFIKSCTESYNNNKFTDIGKQYNEIQKYMNNIEIIKETILKYSGPDVYQLIEKFIGIHISQLKGSLDNITNTTKTTSLSTIHNEMCKINSYSYLSLKVN